MEPNYVPFNIVSECIWSKKEYYQAFFFLGDAQNVHFSSEITEVMLLMAFGQIRSYPTPLVKIKIDSVDVSPFIYFGLFRRYQCVQ